jgi:hypothetical protein
MILFPDDVQAINELLQQRAKLDPELIETCEDHIELEQYDVAIFKAFLVLEGRLQRRGGILGESASKTVSLAFASKGPLTEKLGLDAVQAANFANLLRSAFAVFRNPEAHPQEAIIEYDSAECQAVLAFVNLLLGILDRQPEDIVQAALKQIRRDIGSAATKRLERFLEQVLALDLQMRERKTGPYFRARSLRATQKGSPPKPTRTSVFYLWPGDGNSRLVFSAGVQWQDVEGFNYAFHTDRLKALGCVEGWGGTELELYLRDHNSTEVFERLYAIVRDIVAEMEQSLSDQGEG